MPIIENKSVVFSQLLATPNKASKNMVMQLKQVLKFRRTRFLHCSNLPVSRRQSVDSRFLHCLISATGHRETVVSESRHLHCSTLASGWSWAVDRKLLHCSNFATGRLTIDPFKNPIDEIQPFVEVPIIPQDGNIFNPSKEEMLAAADLFTPSYKHEIQFVTSTVRPDRLPATNIPEVAFIGRSNVGKSSLIQTIFQRVPDVLVKVSKKPGHTRTLNSFQVGRCLTLMDMPGYGYNMPEHFVDSVEGYLHSRKELSRTFLLIDSLVGFTKADWLGLEMMEAAKTPYCIILTKCDKASKHILLRNLMNVIKVREDNTHCCFPQPFLVSSMTGAGVPLLQAFIAYVTGNLSIKGV